MTQPKTVPSDAKARLAKRPNKSVDLTTTHASSSPDMPHERDEKVGMTGGIPSTQVQQGARDLKRGVQDSSRSVEADEAYKKLKR